MEFHAAVLQHVQLVGLPPWQTLPAGQLSIDSPRNAWWALADTMELRMELGGSRRLWLLFGPHAWVAAARSPKAQLRAALPSCTS